MNGWMSSVHGQDQYADRARQRDRDAKLRRQLRSDRGTSASSRCELVGNNTGRSQLMASLLTAGPVLGSLLIRLGERLGGLPASSISSDQSSDGEWLSSSAQGRAITMHPDGRNTGPIDRVVDR